RSSLASETSTSPACSCRPNALFTASSSRPLLSSAFSRKEPFRLDPTITGYPVAASRATGRSTTPKLRPAPGWTGVSASMPSIRLFTSLLLCVSPHAERDRAETPSLPSAHPQGSVRPLDRRQPIRVADLAEHDAARGQHTAHRYRSGTVADGR